ncbi:MAG: glycosyltransferase family 4 protein [Ferruginibacter sp.]
MINKPNVLVIVTPGFPENEWDSTCLPAQQSLIRAMNTYFPQLKIIILSFQYPFVEKKYKWNGNTVIALGGKNRGKLFRWMVWRRATKHLQKINAGYSITGLLSFWCDECAYTAQRFAKKNSLQHYCWLLGQDAKKGNRYVAKMAAPATTYIALSDFISETFANNYSISPANTIPIGIDTNEYSATAKEKTIDIMAAGSLIPLKQYEIFIAVIAELKKTMPDIKAVLCGSGPELKKLQTGINDLSLQQNITLCGERSHEDILDTMQRAKIFLHPSSYEGFGMVCIEALYAGAQVISFCKPVNTPVKNWHIAESKETMIEKARQLLEELPPSEKVLPFSIENTAKAVMKLFGKEL